MTEGLAFEAKACLIVGLRERAPSAERKPLRIDQVAC